MGDEHKAPFLIKYIVLQIVTIPSLFCDLLIFFYLFRHWRKDIVKTPSNHVIFCLLVVSFIQKLLDVPLVLYFLRWHEVFIHNDRFCLIWGWFDYSSIGTCLHLLTWCSIERHLFIFHSYQMKIKRTLILFHYIPLFISLIYLPLFLAFVIFLPIHCVNRWSYDLPFCGGPCYIDLPFLSAFDWIFHCVCPNIIIILVNALLFGRLIWQKIKRNHQIRWKRQRRLVIQLIFISTLFLIFFCPMMIIGVIQTAYKRESLSDIQQNYLYFLPYFTTQLLPFIIAGQLTGMRRECWHWLRKLKVDQLRRSWIRNSAIVTGRRVTLNTT